MTQYLVLSRNGGGPWSEKARVEARSAQAAIRSLIEKGEAEAVTHEHFWAVPTRSYKPVTVQVETKTQLHFR